MQHIEPFFARTTHALRSCLPCAGGPLQPPCELPSTRLMVESHLTATFHVFRSAQLSSSGLHKDQTFSHSLQIPDNILLKDRHAPPDTLQHDWDVCPIITSAHPRRRLQEGAVCQKRMVNPHASWHAISSCALKEPRTFLDTSQ